MKKIHTTIKNFLNEAHVDKYGKLKDMDWEPSSDELWDDKYFRSFVNKNLDYGEEMPEEMYKLLSDNHKKIYREEFIKYGGQIIGYSENETLLDSLLKDSYPIVKREIIEWIEMFPEMGDDGFPLESLLVSKLPEDLQREIIEILINKMDWRIHIYNELYKSFHPSVQKLIEENEETFLLPQL